MNITASVLLASVMLLSGCASVPSERNSQQELLRADQEWAASASEGKDIDRVASFWSDDATIAPAGAPLVIGKPAIRNYVAGSFATPGFHISWKTVQATVSQDGTMGYTTDDTTMTFPGADGKLVTVAARGVTIWRRNADGNWKCVYDIWNYGQ
jgi:ketosteroid isomerase-like protein